MRKYYNELNLIRIVVACGIAFWYHYMIIFGYAPGINVGSNGAWLSDFSYMGVELFFSLSGFVMYMSYHERISGHQVSFPKFMLRRVKRIYPMMILSVCCMAFAQWTSQIMFHHYAILDVYDGRNTIKACFLSILGLNSGWFCDHDQLSINGVTWFISIVMLCYAIYYLITYFAKVKWFRNLLFITMIVFGMGLMAYPVEKPLLYISCARGYLDFFLGVIMAEITDWIEEKNLQKYAGMLGIVGVLLYAVYGWKATSIMHNYAISFALNMGIMFIITNFRIFCEVSSNRVISFAGSIAFEIYLWNLPSFALMVFIIEISKVAYPFDTFVGWIGIITVNVLLALSTKYMVERIEKKVERSKENEKVH